VPSSLASGYRWSAESLHISEQHEHLLSLTCHTTYWEPHNSAALKVVLHDRLAAVAAQQERRQQVRGLVGCHVLGCGAAAAVQNSTWSGKQVRGWGWDAGATAAAVQPNRLSVSLWSP
jgi:hypothetical protein